MIAVERVIRKTWLSQKPKPWAFASCAFWVGIVLGGFLCFQNDILHASQWMSANPQQVFAQQEYWRAWSTLFAHADLAHLGSNLVLFIPFAFYLMGYYNFLLFPLAGFVVGGLVNLLVLKTLPSEITLIGISGVVSWMAAAWLTLYVLIQRNESLRRRLGKAAIVSLILFVPDKFDPHVSYLCHGLGYLFGILAGFIYFLFYRQVFRDAEQVEEVEVQ